MADTKELDVFHSNATCKKCGSNLITTEYDAQLELMKRKCSECGFGFLQLPLDRASESGKSYVVPERKAS